MEIATMPYVAEAAPPPATPKVQGRESGGGQGKGKSADSFAGLMAEAIGDGAGEAAPSTGETAKSADQTDQADQAAASNTMAVLAFQIPANMLPILTAQAMQAPQPSGAAAVTANAETASVSAVQAAGAGNGGQAGQATFAALMATTGQIQNQTAQQPSLTEAANQAIAALMSQVTDEQAAGANTATTPTASATATQQPIAFVPTGPAQTVQPAVAAQQVSQPKPSASGEQQAATTAESQVQGQSVSQTPGQAAGKELPATAAQAQVTPLVKAAVNQEAKPAAQADQPTDAKNGQQATSATTASQASAVTAPAAEAKTTDEQSGGKAANGGGSQEKAAAETTDQTTTPVFAPTFDRQQVASQVTAAADTTQAQPTSDPYNIAGQIVDQAKLITKQDSSEMVIKLKPEHLGEVTMKVTVEAGTVSATFHAANPEVRGAIEATLTQLRQDMTAQGLKVDYVGVYASLDQFFRGDQRQAPQQQIKLSTRRSQDEDSITEAVTAVSSQNQLSGSGGIDYRI